jgi:hypothetical protein
MNKLDLGTDLTWKLSAILENCKRIEPLLGAYLKDSDERPQISVELLAILSDAIEAYELFHPDKMAGEFHGLPPEACSIEKRPQLVIRHSESNPDWDFQPWLLEKLNVMQWAAKGLVREWLKDLSSVRLCEEAPTTPREWLKDGIMRHFDELTRKATTIFEEVCSDKLQIESKT